MLILHIFNNTAEVFTEPYMEFVNKYFDINNHTYIVVGDDLRKIKKQRQNLNFVNKFCDGYLLKKMYSADKIIIHSITNPKYILPLFVQPWLNKKCYWVIWGSDLYFHLNRKNNIKFRIYDFIKTETVKKMKGVCTLVNNDYELAKKWYRVKGIHYQAVYMNEKQHEYIKNIKYENQNSETLQNKTLTILLGNSATKTNNHVEALELLGKFKELDIKIICPLSYGDNKYAEDVCITGKRIFSEKFVALKDHMPQTEYMELLNNIDIAIFNNDRQQALGNIYVLLELGKKVYMRNNTTMWSRISDEMQLNVFNINEIINNSFEEFIYIEKEVKEVNMKKMEWYSGMEYAIGVWREIFDN